MYKKGILPNPKMNLNRIFKRAVIGSIRGQFDQVLVHSDIPVVCSEQMKRVVHPSTLASLRCDKDARFGL